MVEVHNPTSPPPETGIAYPSFRGILKIFSIPELHGMICSLLTTNVFVNCALVSHLLNDLFTPYIWTNLTIHPYQERYFLSQEASSALTRNRDLVRSFITTSIVVLEAFIQAFAPSENATRFSKMVQTNLRTLSLKTAAFIYQGSDNILRAIQWDQSVMALISNSPCLQDLDFTLAQPNVTPFERTFSGLRDLKKLQITSSNVHAATMAVVLDAIPDQVEELTLHMAVIDGNQQVPQYVAHHPPSTTLKKVALHGSILATSEDVEMRVYDRCRGLKALKLIDKLGDVDMANTGTLFMMHCRELKHLEIDTCDRELTDESIAAFISPPEAPFIAMTATPTTSLATSPASLSSPRTPATGETMSLWKSITVRAPEFGPVASASIVKHVGTLEHVTLVQRGLEANDLVTLLTSAPRLKTLVSLSKKGPQHNATFLKPIQANKEPWICSETLEELHLSLRPGYANVRGQDALLNQLSTLTQLRVLHLHNGVQNKMGFTNFSLASGKLSKLQSLRNLEVFEIKHFKHKIGLEERAWMAGQWPKLKRVCLDCEWGHHSYAKQ
ncbi:hypothetical protein BGX28_004076 [Mortierella sp. GBA30]|nr:hypothetical protein BGX28_004076 [Mortierella sp. GBA30]